MTESANPLTTLAPFVAFAQAHPALALGAAFLLPLVIALAYLALRGPAAAPAPRALPRAAEGSPAQAEGAEILETAPRAPAPLPAEAARARPSRLRERLARTSQALIGRIEGIIGGRKLDAHLLDELESLLFTADLGVKTAESLLERVRQQAGGADLEAVRDILRTAILEKLRRVEPAPGTTLATAAKPHVILVLGVNGSGKTTTIGKLAARHVAMGRKVVLGAADTFRAAAIEQLQAWGERSGASVIAGRPGADPSAVAFDTLKAAVARGADVAIIDTAGRLQTKLPLLEELKKIVRVMEREVAGAPHESLLVLDANTGQNALSQARVFTDAARVTALALTKLDGTAKGGVIIGLADELGIPVKFVGVGEGVEDLRDFSAEEFVAALFDERAGDGEGA
ncbi:MAG TPA: signal recognition particle-docking protein FtsY [Myxococcota bacterium]|nr:signal recognition particle-docking protein FtsY [Myxococcota bacterium]